MRIVVYNRWLHTVGGGERHCLALATVLAQRHTVTLVTHQPVDLGAVGAFLGLDLSSLRLQVVPDSPTYRHVKGLAAGCDMFIGASHTDLVPAPAPRNALLVFFPPSWPKPVTGPVVIEGWYALEQGAHGPFRWSEAEATLHLQRSGKARTLHLLLAAPLPQGSVSFACAGQRSVHRLDPTPRWIKLPIPPHAARLELATIPFRGQDDPRELGVALHALRETRRGWLRLRAQEIAAPDMPLVPPMRPELLDGYSIVLANSRFTAGWIERRWQRGSAVLYPPVEMPAPVSEPKLPLILSVGRFFPGGHAKQHALLIEAFKQLRTVSLEGWRLALVGGLDTTAPAHRAYFAELQSMIDDGDIALYPNLPAPRLRELFAQASLYWHAGGYGVDVEHEPERVEHFGITVVEALQAGAVPLVYGAGGPAEIIHSGYDGYHWHAVEELKNLTLQLASNPGRREAIAEAGRRRARDFNSAAFERRVWEIFENYELSDE